MSRSDLLPRRGAAAGVRGTGARRTSAARRAASTADRELLLPLLPAPAQIIEHGVDLLRGQIEVVARAADHHRRVRARRQTLLLDQVETSVGRALAGLDPQPLLDVVQDLVAAA